MGIGAVGIQTTQKKEPVPDSGPPFESDSADNGLSVDSATRRIVLGNNVGDATNPARLLSNREIVTDIGGTKSITLRHSSQSTTTVFNSRSIVITAPNFRTPFINVIAADDGSADLTLRSGARSLTSLNIYSDATGQSTLQVSTDSDNLTIHTDGLGFILFEVGGAVTWRVSTSTRFTQMGATIVNANGADLQVSGTLTNRLLVQSQGAGAYSVDRDLDSNKQFINSAAATFNLPSMAGANNRSGFIFRTCIKNAAGTTIQASAGQVIRFGSLSTSAGGTLVSTDVGAYAVLVWDGTEWITETFLGAWALT